MKLLEYNDCDTFGDSHMNAIQRLAKRGAGAYDDSVVEALLKIV